MAAPYVRSGVLHATITGPSGRPHRFHLRLADKTRDNFLWVDGKQPPLILDPIAAEFFAHYIDAMWEHQRGAADESKKVIEQVVSKMHARHRGLLGILGPSRRRVEKDLHRHIATIMAVADGACPVESGLPAKEIDVTTWVAPARMDLAVTYRCNADCGHCYLTDTQKKMADLPGESWKKILDKLWEIGVPQVVFTGGEPLVREDLVSLVAHADKFVTGLVTNGILLESLAEPLRDASLDYAQVTVESCDPQVHDRMVAFPGAFDKTRAGLVKAISLGMDVVTNTTLTRDNAGTFLDTIRWGHSLGLRSMACNSLICSGRGTAAKRANGLSHEELKKLLSDALDVAGKLKMELQWYSPTCYNDLNPLSLGLGPKSCSAARHNMTVQPDGSVLPCQSWPDAVGNILTDNWESIWNNPTCTKLRANLLAPEKCKTCGLFLACRGGCPLDRAAEGKAT